MLDQRITALYWDWQCCTVHRVYRHLKYLQSVWTLAKSTARCFTFIYLPCHALSSPWWFQVPCTQWCHRKSRSFPSVIRRKGTSCQFVKTNLKLTNIEKKITLHTSPLSFFTCTHIPMHKCWYCVHKPPFPETLCWAQNLSIPHGLHYREGCFPTWCLGTQSQAVWRQMQWKKILPVTVMCTGVGMQYKLIFFSPQTTKLNIISWIIPVIASI